MLWVRVLINFALLYKYCESFKILGVFHIPTTSHHKLALKLFTEISENGHEVTLITPYPEKNKSKNLKSIPLEGLQKIVTEKWQGTQNIGKSVLLTSSTIMLIQYELSEHVLRNEKVQKLMSSKERFDAVIVWEYMNGALFGLAEHFKAPLILVSSMPLFANENYLLSQVGLSSYIPNILTDHTNPMNFRQRIMNTFYDVYMILYYMWYEFLKVDKLLKETISDKSDLYNLYKNVSLLLTNTHLSTHDVIPVAPNMVEIGGYHIEDPKPLPQDLQQFLDGSNSGVILFSMGALMKSADFPEEKLQTIIKVFAKLKQTVLWKYENDVFPGLPNNVKIMKWLPQIDILAHPNVKAFISHGGLSSTIESVYMGKPIVGIPCALDQKKNIAFVVLHGCGVEVPYEELTEEKLEWALSEVLYNRKYRDNVKKRSLIMKDRPMKPLDAALYWIEHVIRRQKKL